jgi:hypothetical protein
MSHDGDQISRNVRPSRLCRDGIGPEFWASICRLLRSSSTSASTCAALPVVCSPEDAFRCFMGSEIEVWSSVIALLCKEDQDPMLKLGYKHAFEMD